MNKRTFRNYMSMDVKMKLVKCLTNSAEIYTFAAETKQVKRL